MPSASEFQMTLIGPYKGVDAAVFRQVARELNCHLHFVDAVFDEAVEPAKRLSPDSCDVVLSRGVTVDGMVPSQENAANGSYNITRLLYMNTKGEPTGLTALFIGYIYSEDGKAFISDSGYIPLERKR